MNETLKGCSAASSEALEKATSHDDMLKHLQQLSKELEEKSAHHDQ